MNIFRKNDNNFSIEEIEKAEILEAFTRKLKGEKLSHFQNKLLKSKRYEKQLAPLKQLIKQAHEAEKKATEIVVPRPGAKRRVKTKILELISDREEAHPRTWKLNPSSVVPVPVSPEPVGSDSSLEVTVYDEMNASVLNKYLLRFKVIEGDEIGSEYSVNLTELSIDDQNLAEVSSQKSVTVGRGSSAEIKIKDSSNRMSRVHAKFYIKNNSVYIDDYDSTNGTYVDGVKVTNSSELFPNSIVRMGEVTIQILSIDRVL